MASDNKMEIFPVKQKKESYFREIQRELKKISWTSKKELILSTKIVIISTFVFSIGIYFSDLIIRELFSSISNLVRLIAG
jgi:preprotein translocase SecE subunit